MSPNERRWESSQAEGLSQIPGETLAKVHTRCAGRWGLLHTHWKGGGPCKPGEGPDVAVEEQEESGRPQGAGEAEECWRCSSLRTGEHGKWTKDRGQNRDPGSWCREVSQQCRLDFSRHCTLPPLVARTVMFPYIDGSLFIPENAKEKSEAGCSGF